MTPFSPHVFGFAGDFFLAPHLQHDGRVVENQQWSRGVVCHIRLQKWGVFIWRPAISLMRALSATKGQITFRRLGEVPFLAVAVSAFQCGISEPESANLGN
jgi:hypothetical protein